MAERLARLSDAERALLTAELAKRRERARNAAAIPPRPPGEPPELSLAQRRLWFLDRIAPGRPTYNATLTMRIAGKLDPAVLHDALDTVVQRHESLRTVGLDVDGIPQGRLLDTGVSWRTADVAEAELADRLAENAREPFDLSRDVLLRATLYRLAPELHVLILVLHHIASDGWSRGILFAELTEIYNARVTGREPVLKPLPIQYGDYARWQNAAVASGQLTRDEDFWRAELLGADLMLDLPTDYPRDRQAGGPGSRVPEHRGERVAMESPRGYGDALRQLARGEGATFFMATMAAGGAFLSALTGQDDIVLGSPVANRLRPELEGLIGFFVNTVVLRVRLHGDPTFRELVRRCRQTAVACFAHQDMPFDRLVELINPVRVPGRNPLFQVNFRMQGVAPPPPQLVGLKVTRMITDTGTARFELALGLVDQPDTVRGYLEYEFALFRRGTIEAWQGAFVDLVGHVVRDPDMPISQLRSLTRTDVDRRREQAAAVPRPRPGIRRRA